MSKLTSKGLVPTTVLVIPADWKQFQKLAIETGTSGSVLVRGFIRSTVLKAAKEAVQVAPVKTAQRSLAAPVVVRGRDRRQATGSLGE
jgi:hypothetical protein